VRDEAALVAVKTVAASAAATGVVVTATPEISVPAGAIAMAGGIVGALAMMRLAPGYASTRYDIFVTAMINGAIAFPIGPMLVHFLDSRWRWLGAGPVEYAGGGIIVGALLPLVLMLIGAAAIALRDDPKGASDWIVKTVKNIRESKG